MPEIAAILQRHLDCIGLMLADEAMHKTIAHIISGVSQTFKSGGKVLMCGNGGSAADAQHLAAEFSGRFYKDREPLFAEALHVNTSYLTAVANDYSYEEVYARMLRAMGRPGDWLFAFSTSGNSPNVVRAAEAAAQRGMHVVGFTGAAGGALRSLSDHLLNVPSDDTPRIQEGHILLGHVICEGVEGEVFR